MRSPVATAVAVAVVAGLGAAAIGGTGLIAIAFVAGAAIGAALHRIGMRQLVVIATTAAAVVGAVIGKTVVDALCLPGTCAPLSWVAAALMAIGALVGVGLVVALATRSFEEHRLANEPPQRPGGEPPQ